MKISNTEILVITILLILCIIALYFLTYYTAYQDGVKSVSHAI